MHVYFVFMGYDWGNFFSYINLVNFYMHM